MCSCNEYETYIAIEPRKCRHMGCDDDGYKHGDLQWNIYCLLITGMCQYCKKYKTVAVPSLFIQIMKSNSNYRNKIVNKIYGLPGRVGQVLINDYWSKLETFSEGQLHIYFETWQQFLRVYAKLSRKYEIELFDIETFDDLQYAARYLNDLVNGAGYEPKGPKYHQTELSFARHLSGVSVNHNNTKGKKTWVQVARDKVRETDHALEFVWNHYKTTTKSSSSSLSVSTHPVEGDRGHPNHVEVDEKKISMIKKRSSKYLRKHSGKRDHKTRVKSPSIKSFKYDVFMDMSIENDFEDECDDDYCYDYFYGDYYRDDDDDNDDDVYDVYDDPHYDPYYDNYHRHDYHDNFFDDDDDDYSFDQRWSSWYSD